MPKDVPREAAIVKAIVSRIRTEYPGALVLKYHGGPHSVAGHPDLYGSVYGLAFALEVKRPGGRPTALQSARLDEWHRAGAITGTPGECAYVPIRRNARVFHLLLVGGGHAAQPGAREGLPETSLKALRKNLSTLKIEKIGISRSDLGGLTDAALAKTFQGVPLWVVQ